MKFYKIITASIEMKLVIFSSVIISLAVLTKCQRIQQEQFQFSPHFQTPSSGVMVSDSSIYLPPEPHTPMPYFAVNNINKLPYQFLPPSATKAPSMYPTPYAGVFSSSMRPNFENDETDDERINQVQITSPRPALRGSQNLAKKNITDLKEEKKNLRALPKMFNYQQQQSKADEKHKSMPFQHISTEEPLNQNVASRRMIITSEINRNDDHLKSYSNSQFSQMPNIFFSSTTEPAIPILRLSNEMDLDGSFSYEALGADQTHYVQHSRMENMGTGKEEQVVEGSYSYVGDNGQTYTVHYIADSNGYRASGDHLPSPPPIPEIIQRAIQYNLAEEARRPPHMRSSWEEDSDKDVNVDDKGIHFAAPPRSLFTGKTPEAFSFGFSQNSNNQNNVVESAASSHIPKTSFDIAVELSKAKAKSGSISPQITFSASQGAHTPSSPLQQSIPRSVSNDKSPLPQIMNYEASSRELDQENKPLWRWQYGLNANVAEPNPNKNTISRSFAEGDDVIINFNDMSPQHYTNMIKSQIIDQKQDEYDNNFKNAFLQSTPSSSLAGTPKYVNNKILNSNENEQNTYRYPLPKQEMQIYGNINQDYFKNNQLNNIENQKNMNSYSTVKEKSIFTTTENINTQTSTQSFNKLNDFKEENKVQSKLITPHPYPGLIRQQNFMPSSQFVTQSYDYEDSGYEFKKVISSTNSYLGSDEAYNVQKYQTHTLPPSKYWHNADEFNKSSTTITPYLYSTSINLPSNTKQAQEINNFRPITYTNNFKKEDSTTTEKSMDDLIRENIFLKNIVRDKKEENVDKFVLQQKEEQKIDRNSEVKNEKHSKYIQTHPKPQNEIKTVKKKPLDINDVLNYIAMKNHFELSKTKPKTMSTISNYQSKATPVNFIPIKEDKRENIPDIEENYTQRTLSQQQEELQGIIKNYKVLQRQRNSGFNHVNNQNSDSPQRHVKLFNSENQPPLGRAGPSMKSYLPPAYL